MESNTQKKGTLYVIISTCLFGTMPLFAKISYSNGSNAYSLAFYRFFLAFLILFVVIKFVKKESVGITRAQAVKILWIAIPYGVVPVMLYISYESISTSLATTLHFTYPIFVIVITMVLFREKPGIRKLLCCLLCMAGIGFLYTPSGSLEMVGIILALVSGIIYGAAVVIIEKCGLEDFSKMKLTMWMSLFSSIEIGIAAIAAGELRIRIAPMGWVGQLSMALFPTVIGLILFQKGTYICGSVKSSLLSTFEPITGVVIGLAVFHEVLTVRSAMGVLLVLISTVVLVLPPLGRVPFCSRGRYRGTGAS